VYASRVKPSSDINLKSISPRQSGGLEEDHGRDAFEALAYKLGELGDLMSAAATHSLLVVVQGMDTAGKDGSIRDVFSQVNPSHCRVASFKVPSATELAHDFLWRVHQQTPERGQIVVFNRSHYEDVLVVRVMKLAPKKTWSARYDQINAFEQHLANNNTIIVKFFLHISKEEQEERLLDREADPLKSWKLAVQDWKNREYWADYQRAYTDALNKCSTKVAPWYIIPADRKWFRNLAMAEVLVETLNPYAKGWREFLAEQSKQRLVELTDARATGVIPPTRAPVSAE
jgi:PPK2 family polyphosphate:nucleotide phosphotransferase